MTPGRPPARHLRPRGDGLEQPITTVELFFDLVYVFAVTQLSHLILDDLSVGSVARAAFLLLIVWWAWIYTTWMVNWFDPASLAVRAVLTGVMLVSLLMAAALPGAFGGDGMLFAISYVTLQVGRNVAAASLLRQDHPLRDVFERLVGWSAASGALWLAGAALRRRPRGCCCGSPRVVLDLVRAGRRLLAAAPGPRRDRRLRHRGRPLRRALPGLRHHRARRVDRRDRRHGRRRRPDATVVLCLVVAFLETAALWWLYFGAVAERARAGDEHQRGPGPPGARRLHLPAPPDRGRDHRGRRR